MQNDARSAPARCPVQTEAFGPFRPYPVLSSSGQKEFTIMMGSERARECVSERASEGGQVSGCE